MKITRLRPVEPRRVAPVPVMLPQSLEAERAVLGGLLLDTVQVLEIAETLRVEHFYGDHHRKIYDLLVSAARRGEPMDVLGLADHIMAAGIAQELGGLAYAASLPEHVPTTENLERYASIIRERATRRDLIEVSHQIRSLALDAEVELELALTRAKAGLEQIDRGDAGAGRDREVFGVAYDWVDEVERREQAMREGRLTVLNYGLPSLVKFGCPLPGDVVIVAGRPAMGKTQLTMQVLISMAQQAKRLGLPGVVALYSLEMSSAQLVARAVSVLCGQDERGRNRLPYKLLLDPTVILSREQARMRRDAVAELAELPIVVNETSRSIEEIRASVVRLARKRGGILAVGLDYLQLATSSEVPADNRVTLLGHIAYTAKETAKLVGAPFFLVAQLNRGVEARADKRPLMSDLEGSGAIEAAADRVFMLYRPGYYDPDSGEQDIAEVICRKARNGTTGTTKLRFEDGTFTDTTDDRW